MKLTAFALVSALSFLSPGRLLAQDAAPRHAIVGAWTLNTGLSDQPPAPGERGQNRGARGGSGRGGFGGGRFGGGRGGVGGGGFGGGGARGDVEGMERRREAMRQILAAPDKMTITETGAMVIVTTGEGMTTRLSTDNKKIKDGSTGIERKTRWEADKLVTEISGAGPGKIVQTYAVDPETGRLTMALEFQGGNGQRPPLKRVYDRAD